MLSKDLKVFRLNQGSIYLPGRRGAWVVLYKDIAQFQSFQGRIMLNDYFVAIPLDLDLAFSQQFYIEERIEKTVLSPGLILVDQLRDTTWIGRNIHVYLENGFIRFDLVCYCQFQVVLIRSFILIARDEKDKEETQQGSF